MAKKANKGPRAKFNWKFGFKDAMIDGLLVGAMVGVATYLNQRIGFCKGANAVLEGKLDQIIKVKE